MDQIIEYLPFIIPLLIAQFALLIFTVVHILRHEHYKRGTRLMWLIIVIVGMEFVGPILYFVLGKEDN